MPNWCQNYLTFSGENESKALDLFRDLEKECKELQQGVVADFLSGFNHYLFDVYVDGDVAYFQTKWSPPIDEIKQIGEHLDVDFILEYTELGNPLFGSVVRKDGLVEERELEGDDFNMYTKDEDRGEYTYEGVTHCSEEEVLELILDKKYSKLCTD
jgi:hypothetical protein